MADSNPSAVLPNDARLPLPEEVALVLQGGGALGAYQAGVYEALAATGIEIDWVAGISIGAVNAAIIAGNPPADRVAKLRSFWCGLSSALPSLPLAGDSNWQELVHVASAGYVLSAGVPGFFKPRWLPPYASPAGTMGAISFYDTSPLIETLDAHVDWELLNSGPTRLSVGAVNVESGNFRYFNTGEERLDVRHILASGALPPGLPPVEIDGCWWWDGGLVSNTPLDHVLKNQTEDMLIFQVDLFPAHGERPRTLSEVYSREKDIRYSSRTRQVTDTQLRLRRERELIRAVLTKLPSPLCDDADVVALRELAAEHAANIVHLIYRARSFERGARDFEFSRDSMEHHWDEGAAAVARTMAHGALLAQNIVDGKTAAFDLAD